LFHAYPNGLENNLISGFWADKPIGFEHPKVVIWNKGGNTYESSLKTESVISEILYHYKFKQNK